MPASRLTAAGDDGLEPWRGHFRQKHGGHKADGDAQDDGARRAVDAGQDEGQNAELAVSVPLESHTVPNRNSMRPISRMAGMPGDNEIYGDEQHAAHRYQSQQQEPAVDDVLQTVVSCFHIRTSYMQGKAAPLRDVACPPVGLSVGSHCAGGGDDGQPRQQRVA